MEYEDLRTQLKDRFDVHDLVDLLGITEDDILDEFKNKVTDKIEEVLDALGFETEDESEVE